MKNTTTTLHVTIDHAKKIQAQKLAKSMGLDLSTVVKASIQAFLDTQSFQVSKAYTMTPYLERVIQQAKQDESKNVGNYGPFKTADESVKFLRSKKWKK